MYVPPTVCTNDDLARLYGMETSDEWIHQRTGIRERRHAEAGWAAHDMALPASEAALEQAGLAASGIDLIVFATLSPKHAFPGDGVYLQRALGLCGDSGTFAPALDVRNQCSGFLYGLSVANAMIASGGANHVLVVGAEAHSAALDFSTRGRTVASLFGDGAGAVVLGPSGENEGITHITLGADGRYADELCQKVWDMSRRPYIDVGDDGFGRVPPSEMWASMDGRTVYRHAVQRMCEVVHNLCDKGGVAIEEIERFYFHQANLRINQAVAQRLGIDMRKVPTNIDRYGNTTAATLPLLLAEDTRNGALKPGMKVACVAFGSGFTWGGALIDW
jgi:3-oxoacyl-[acyl-carrier-protein] synthase-3